MSNDTDNDNLDDIAAEIADKIDSETEQQENPSADAAETGEAEPSAKQNAIGEDKEKTSKPEEVEPSAKQNAIEPPASWPSDDREAFKALPQFMQETIARRESERDAYLNERSRVLAAKEREFTDAAQRANQAQQMLAAAQEQNRQIINQLLPAKFSDIQSDADYLKMKSTDPARASEYDAFVAVLNSSVERNAAVENQRMAEHLSQELRQLQDKYPEFRDEAKCRELLDGVRKTACEYYGFSPQEVRVIQDHRYVQILRDASAWKQHQANLKAAAAKKVAPQPTRVLRETGEITVKPRSEMSSKILNRAAQTSDLHAKAEALARLFA